MNKVRQQKLTEIHEFPTQSVLDHYFKRSLW